MNSDFKYSNNEYAEKIRRVGKNMIEKALYLRAVSYMSMVKQNLLAQTLAGVDHDRKHLMHLNKELINRHKIIEQQKTELEIKNKELDEANKIKNMFIASLSHEIRTPVNSIYGFAKLLVQRDLPEKDQTVDQLARIYRSADHLRLLISNLLDISKIEAGSLIKQVEPVSVKQLMLDALETVKEEANTKGIQLQTIINDDITIQTDPLRLKQALINLYSNALKYTQHGRITGRLESTRDHAIIQISDTGIGINEKDQAFVFEPFVQMNDHARIKSQSGEGLGLYITQRLVREVLGGSLSLASTPGQGSTFTIKIPIQ